VNKTDPNILKVFYAFLREVKVPAEKIRLWLLLYPDLVDSVQKNFWSKLLGIPSGRFTKSIFIKGRSPAKRLSYGVCNIEVYSRELKEKLLQWLELLQDDLLLKRHLKNS